MPGPIGVVHHRCPCCLSDHVEEYGTSDGFRMDRCDRCGTLYTATVPTEAFRLARYSAEYFTDEYIPSVDDAAEVDAELQHLDNLLGGIDRFRSAGDRLLEIGVGSGKLLHRAEASGWKASGIDVNAASVAHCRDVLGLDVVVADVDTHDFGCGQYGAVVSEMSIEHLTDPRGAVQLWADALVDGGAVLIWTVAADGESVRSKGMASELIGPAEHLFLFTDTSLRMICEAAGLRVAHCWYDPSGDAVGIIAEKSTHRPILGRVRSVARRLLR